MFGPCRRCRWFGVTMLLGSRVTPRSALVNLQFPHATDRRYAASRLADLRRHNGAMDTPAPARPVASWPCQSVCLWRATGEVWADGRHRDLRVFACTGCGSEWVRTEQWTPIDAHGAVPEAIRLERRAD